MNWTRLAAVALVLGLLGVGGCGARDVARPVADPASVASAPSTPSTTALPTAVLEVRPDDVRLARALVRLAVDRSTDAAGRVPLAETVELRHGSLRSTLAREQATYGAAWDVPGTLGGLVGPFNALESLTEHAARTGVDGSGPVRRGFVVGVGPHRRCAAPVVPTPAGYDGWRQVWIQPADGTTDSCLDWFSADLWVDDAGQVAAVTLDLFEPGSGGLAGLLSRGG